MVFDAGLARGRGRGQDETQTGSGTEIREQKFEDRKPRRFVPWLPVLVCLQGQEVVAELRSPATPAPHFPRMDFPRMDFPRMDFPRMVGAVNP